MRQRRLKVNFWLDLLFHHPGKAVQSAETAQFLCMTDFGLLQRPPQDGQRLIIGFQRDREGMPIFAPVRE